MRYHTNLPGDKKTLCGLSLTVGVKDPRFPLFGRFPISKAAQWFIEHPFPDVIAGRRCKKCVDMAKTKGV